MQATLPVGSVIRDRYLVQELLSTGLAGAGAIYLVSAVYVEDQRGRRYNARRFALKEIISPDKKQRVQISIDCMPLKAVNHPALPQFYDIFTVDKQGRVYILMEYVKGLDVGLLRLRQPEKRFSWPQAMSLMTPVMEAVSYLHQLQPPIIHQNIKPANIILTASNTTVLVDFGVKKKDNAQPANATRHRSQIGFEAPEQYSEDRSARTDVYGLGATFYLLLTGMAPPTALNRITQLEDGKTDPLVPLNQIVPSISPRTAEHIQQALSLNREERFATVEEFRQALESVPVQEAPEPIVLHVHFRPQPSPPVVAPVPEPPQPSLAEPAQMPFLASPPIAEPPQPSLASHEQPLQEEERKGAVESPMSSEPPVQEEKDEEESEEVVNDDETLEQDIDDDALEDTLIAAPAIRFIPETMPQDEAQLETQVAPANEDQQPGPGEPEPVVVLEDHQESEPEASPEQEASDVTVRRTIMGRQQLREMKASLQQESRDTTEQTITDGQQLPEVEALPEQGGFDQSEPDPALELPYALSRTAPEKRRSRHMAGKAGMVLAVLVLALVIAAGTGIGFFIANHTGGGSAPTIAASSVVPTTVPTTSPESTATASSSPTGALTASYGGTILDLSTNKSTAMFLSQVKESQGSFQGLFSGLHVNKPFNGSINSSGHVQFGIRDATGHQLYSFVGDTQPGGGLTGSFCQLNQQAQCSGAYGIWQVTPVS